MIVTICDQSNGRIGFYAKGDEAYEAFNSVSIFNTALDMKWATWNRTVSASVSEHHFYRVISAIASYVNNELGDEFILEVE